MSKQTDNVPMDRKFLPFELKAVDLRASTFVGNSAGIGNRDLGNDIIMPGAFKKTIRERVKSRKVKFLDNHNSHTTRAVWGTVVDAKEVPVEGRKDEDNAPSHKIETTFEVSREDPDAQVALRKIAERHLDALSIGYRPVVVEFEADDPDSDDAKDPRLAWLWGHGVRRIKELQWWETSVVVWGMNPEADIVQDSVERMVSAARKAAMAGVPVPEDRVREAIVALKSLSACDADPSAERVACVRKAADAVQQSARTLHALLADGGAGVGDILEGALDDATKAAADASTGTVVTVPDDLEDGPAEDDEKGSGDAEAEGGGGDDEGTADDAPPRAPAADAADDDDDDEGAGAPAPDADAADDAAPAGTGEAPDDQAAQEDAGEGGPKQQNPLVSAVLAMTRATEKLVSILDADGPEDGTAGGVQPEPDGAEAADNPDEPDPEGGHVEQEGAAKDAGDGRPKHSHDDALADELSRIEMLGLKLQLDGAAD